jgi:salicylate hydroxylase
MTPLQGQGANQAIEDAEGLLLLNEGDVSRDGVHAVLKQWERVRLPRASKVQKISLDAVDNMNGSNAYVYGKHYFMYPGIREGLRRLDEGQEVVPWVGK